MTPWAPMGEAVECFLQCVEGFSPSHLYEQIVVLKATSNVLRAEVYSQVTVTTSANGASGCDMPTYLAV